MDTDYDLVHELRQDLELLLSAGIAADSLDHAYQIAAITNVLQAALANAGMTATLVGGAAIEVYAPGIYASSDIDLIVEDLRGPGIRDRIGAVFEDLGFEKSGRHWIKGDLFVEVPAHSLDDPATTEHVGPFELRIIAKESLLADRIVGFKHWRQTSYGQQAIDMIAAFGDDLDLPSLETRLAAEDALDAFGALRTLARSEAPVTQDVLEDLLNRLND